MSHGLCIASKPQEKYCAKDTSRSLQWKYNGIEVFGLSFDGLEEGRTRLLSDYHTFANIAEVIARAMGVPPVI